MSSLVLFPDLNPPQKGLAAFSNILEPHLILIVQQVTCFSVDSASCSSRVVQNHQTRSAGGWGLGMRLCPVKQRRGEIALPVPF